MSAAMPRGNRTAVNGLCTSPYATCVGGTEFSEGANAAQYWSATNSGGLRLGAWLHSRRSVERERARTAARDYGHQAAARARCTRNRHGSERRRRGRGQWHEGCAGRGAAAADHDGYFVVENGSFWIVSGTSAAAPSFAGIMALVIEAKTAAPGQCQSSPLCTGNRGCRSVSRTPSGNNSVPGVEGFWAKGATYNLATGLGRWMPRSLVEGWSDGELKEFPLPRPIGCSRFGPLPATMHANASRPIRLLGRP